MELSSSTSFSVVEDRLIHQGAVVGLYHREIKGPTGETYRRDFVQHPGAVAIVAVEDGHVYLVEQYRASLDRNMIEIPAGKLDVSGEPPIETARRELEEEIGRRAGSLEPLVGIHHSAGFCDEYGHMFLAEDLTEVPQRLEGPEEEDMTVLRVPMAEAIEMVADGRITDGKSMVGLLLVARQLRV